MSDRAAKVAELRRLRKVEELKVLRAGTAEPEAVASPAIGSMPEVAPADERSTMEKVGAMLKKSVGAPAAAALETTTTPLRALDRFTHAPIRAGMGVLQDGGSAAEVGDAALEQFKAGLPGMGKSGELLESTPTSEEIALKGIRGAGIRGEYAATIAPLAAIAVDVALDPMNAIPTDLVAGAAKGVVRGASKAAGAAAKAATRIEMGIARGIARTGQVMTQGVLKADRALDMYREISALEMLMPGTKDFGAMAKQGQRVAAFRSALREKPITVPGSHDVAQQLLAMISEAEYRAGRTPGSERLLQMIRERAFESRPVVDAYTGSVTQGAYGGPMGAADATTAVAVDPYTGVVQSGRAGPTPRPQASTEIPIDPYTGVVQKVEKSIAADPLPGPVRAPAATLEAVADPYTGIAPGQGAAPTPARGGPAEQLVARDLTLDELDDLVREADDLGFTPVGNPRSQPAKWAPTVMGSRRLLNDAMQTVPAGQMFQEEKSHFAGLATAGQKRSKLVETMANAGTLAVGATIGSLGGWVLSPAAIAVQALKPSTYVNMLGVLKVPREMATSLRAAYDTGRIGIMRDALTQVAQRYPAATERLIRATALVSAKPLGRETLSPEEADTLAETRSFDPAEIEAERARILGDKSIPSTMRARALSDINRNGYVTTEGKEPARPMPQGAQMLPPPEASIEALLRAIKTSAPPKK